MSNDWYTIYFVNKLFLTVFAVLAILLVFFYIQKTPSSKPFQTKKPIPASIYSAWVPTWDLQNSLESLASSSAKLSYLSPVWYKLDPSQKVLEINGGQKEEIKTIAKSKGIKLIPTIFNEFDGSRVSKFLKDEINLENQIEVLIKIAQDQDFKGFDVDFEEISYLDKDIFSSFIKTLSEKLHAKKLLLFVSVQAQTGSSQDRDSVKAQDLKEISKYADFLRVMIYDYHNTQTAPGPITPIDEYKKVLEYIKKIVPEDKIVIGLPLYGYLWSGKNDPITFKQTLDLSKKFKVALKRNETSLEQVMTYSDKQITNTIWVEDSESVIFKIKIARELGIYQFSFWRLGGEDLSLWEKI